MTRWLLVKRSVAFRFRAHLGVVIGAAAGTAALVGALLVGDSVRGTLVHRALQRLGPINYAVSTPDRFFQSSLKVRLAASTESLGRPPVPGRSLRPGTLVPPSLSPLAAGLMLPGVVVRQDGSARANSVNVIGVETPAWPRMAGWGKLSKGIVVSDGEGQSVQLDEVARMQLGRGEGPLTAWKAGETALVNQALAQQLHLAPGDELLLRVRKPSALSADAVLTPKDESAVAVRLRVGAVLAPEMLGDFSLRANQSAPLNLFLPLETLSQTVEMSGRANLLLNGPVLSLPAGEAVAQLEDNLRQHFLPEDAGVVCRPIEQPASVTGGEYMRPVVEISTSRIFLDEPVVNAALTPRQKTLNPQDEWGNDGPGDVAFAQFVTNGVGVLTYVANLIFSEQRATPYSMVTASDGDLVPQGMKDDEIVVNDWLANDLAVKLGDTLRLSYYVADSATRLTERTNTFRVLAVVPLQGRYADRTLMPDFPGLAKAESTSDWDAGFPLVYRIREKDEAYWKAHRGTPKAFVTMAAGQKMWANRFGSLTAIRYEVPTNSFPQTIREAVYRNLAANLDPAAVGLSYEPVREQALQGATQSQDFGQLFLGFSFFVIIAALLLMALLFRFSLEQRASETGTLLALGFTPSQVRRLLLAEGLALAFLGGLAGVAAGLGYARAMLWGLTTIWRQAVGTGSLTFYATFQSLAIGLVAALLVAALAIWLVLRKQARQPARELLGSPGGGSTLEDSSARRRKPNRALWLSVVSGLGAAGTVAWAAASHDSANAEAFFTAGALMLVAGVAASAVWLAASERGTGVRPSRAAATSVRQSGSAVEPAAPRRNMPHRLGLVWRGVGRRPSRSLTTVALLASGTFIIVSLGVFRLDANRDAGRRDSGTGGFALLGESSLPVVPDLATPEGRDAVGLDPGQFPALGVVPLRVREGDDASCLNLNRAQKPRLLGVKPSQLDGRFAFSGAAEGVDSKEGWEMLRKQNLPPGETREDEVPAIGDAASIQWALGLKLGDTLDYTDEFGRTFKLRLVGALANSILQGSLIIDEAEFVKRFPSESGYRMFLVDAPAAKVSGVSASLSRSLADSGLEVVSTVERLNRLNAVQNTYLGTFQVLGGLGLLLGSAGLGVVVLRNVLERRAELAVLLAVGFRRRSVGRMVLTEHALLLGAGLGLGILAAALAVFPALTSSRGGLPLGSLAVTLGAVLLNGLFWTWLATRWALRGQLLAALRNE